MRLQPLTPRGLVRNRVVVSPTATYSAGDGIPTA
jgi:2,4-dienoyl-CoA reductase-like NADH-dependent reductase (Old Yellow Enzyme family)